MLTRNWKNLREWGYLRGSHQLEIAEVAPFYQHWILAGLQKEYRSIIYCLWIHHTFPESTWSYLVSVKLKTLFYDASFRFIKINSDSKRHWPHWNCFFFLFVGYQLIFQQMNKPFSLHDWALWVWFMAVWFVATWNCYDFDKQYFDTSTNFCVNIIFLC